MTSFSSADATPNGQTPPELDATPDTVIELNDRAMVCESMGQYREAEELYQQALAIAARTFGSAHPHTLGIRNNLVASYEMQAGKCKAQGDFNQAVVLLEKAIALRSGSDATAT